MLHLLLITLVPFTTMLIGRYPTLAPAVWFYAANTAHRKRARSRTASA
jgi:hypothetical protein